MNSKALIVFASSACMLASAVAAENYPNPADSPSSGVSPNASYVWMAGHWNSEGGKWRWLPAHWELPPSTSAVWVNGHWAARNGAWVWINGSWNVGEAQQAEATPPQPPGGPADERVQGTAPVVQATPMPATPAPYISGGYAPGGVVRVVEQPIVTDYGPIEYASPYPGYYWSGDAWLWGGFPGAYVGLGWGPGYGGWGRSYYGGRGDWDHREHEHREWDHRESGRGDWGRGDRGRGGFDGRERGGRDGFSGNGNQVRGGHRH